VVIERKANGQAVLDDLAGVVPFLGAFDPAGSKEARAGVLASAMESGDVAIPHPDSQHVERVEASWQDVAPLLAEAERRGEQWPLRCRQRPDGSCLVPWVVLWEAEVRAFPAGRNDDQVDASSQAVIYLADHYVAPLDCRELNRQPATSAWQDIGVPPPSAWADGSWNGSA
jgi:hypothetical protein